MSTGSLFTKVRERSTEYSPQELAQSRARPYCAKSTKLVINIIIKLLIKCTNIP